MATSDGRRVNRPYRKASEYLATSKQATYNGPRTVSALEHENIELREKLTTTVRRMENMEVEFEQSREYFSSQLDITTDKLNRTTQTLKLLQRSYSELQSINYELEQRILKVNQLENEKSQLSSDIHDLASKLTDARTSLNRTKKENERLRKDCNLAVQLLECNAGNFKQQKTDQLPRELQHRVEEYRMDLSQYNEYINPYSADSDGENETRTRPSGNEYSQETETVPAELLAKVLQKPENVHLNLEETDYINDPDLNSVYRGKIAEQKLVKYEYETPEPPSGHKSATVPRSSNKNNNQQGRSYEETRLPRSSSGVQGSSPWEMSTTAPSGVQNSSPWEMGPTVPPGGDENSGSPWEMSPSVRKGSDDIDDDGAASAYGAYPVSYRRPKQSRPTRYNFDTMGSAPASPQKEPPSVKKTYANSEMSATFNKVTSPKIRKPKGNGENEDVYISQTYKQTDKQNVAATSQTSSSSSRKSTPAKLPVDLEKGSFAEKSSLLDQVGSDGEDMVMTVEIGGGGPTVMSAGSPMKRYREAGGAEGQGLLNDSDPESDERELDEEEGERREYEEDLGEIEEGNMKEPVKREVPEMNLLNLDDNATILGSNNNSPAHIMMQQLLHDLESPVTDLGSRTLLPDLPPPSGFSEQEYDGQLIVGGDMMVPPPPDMYVETPITHPQMTDQSTNEIAGHQSGIMTSQASNKNSLDDLQLFAGLEINNQHINDKEKAPEMVSVPSSGYDSNVTIEKNDLKQLEVENRSEPAGGDFDAVASGVPSSGGEVQPSQENVTERSDEDLDSNEGLPQDNSEDTNLENGSTENHVLNLDEIEKGNTADFDEESTENYCYENAGGEKQENEEDNGNNESSQNTSSDQASSGNTESGFSGNTENTESETDQINGNTGILKSYTNSVTSEGTANVSPDFEPLEVVDLQQEPRGGSHNRRRRNSFDQAREYGSVLED